MFGLIPRFRDNADFEVSITSSAMREFLDTVGRHPPETVGIFGGYLEGRPLITNFRFCPPRRRPDGSFDRTRVHVNVDDQYMNFVIDNEWRPNGKYIVGIGHSHPSGSRSLSSGDLCSNEGDMVFMKSCLANDDSPGLNWAMCYAPILTFDRFDDPVVDWWGVSLKDARPLRGRVTIVDDDSRVVRRAQAASHMAEYNRRRPDGAPGAQKKLQPPTCRPQHEAPASSERESSPGTARVIIRRGVPKSHLENEEGNLLSSVRPEIRG